MRPNITLKFANDISVVVPDSLNLITTYVLREQGDWFEDEIKFVRLLLKPNQKAIDIGANYGLFTLSMAKIVGPGGSIWAFEPASSTAALLSDSLAINGFRHVVLDQRALSEHAGTAQLSLNDNSELNELVRDGASPGASETVTLISLDDAMQEHGWSDIDFVKIDAEGEEGAIIRGGKKFFQTQSPLVQYEVKAAQTVHLELVQAFADIGYSSYRLVPGLGALVPFDAREEVDGYLLNLFCCKPDRAEKIAAVGRLVLADDVQAEEHTRRADALPNAREGGSAYRWQDSLTRLPYGKLLAGSWQQTVRQGQSGEVEKALALHGVAHDKELPISERFLALRTSLKILTAVWSAQPEFLRLASLARVAREFGAREVAVTALANLFQIAVKYQKVNPNEPFLAVSEHFGSLDPKEAIGNWVVCSVLEELERSASFSSFYSDPSARQRLETIRNLGFGSPEMARRLALVEQRFFGTTDVPPP
jgi:protein O-GlcNAc transferase